MTTGATSHDASYETFLRVKNGVSDAALRAAGLPPAQSLTYDDYLATFGGQKEKQQAALDRLRGSHRSDEAPAPGPPPLGRRVVLEETADGNWRIVTDPGLPQAVAALPPRRYVAKAVAMVMGIATAFVLAAYIAAVSFRSEQPTTVAAPVTVPGLVLEDVPAQVAADPAAITAPEPALDLDMETASGKTRPSPAEPDGAATQPASAEIGVQQIGAEKTDAKKTAAEKAGVLDQAAEATTPAPKAKPLQLPSSTPTAKQQRLPSSTPKTEARPVFTKPASTP